MGTLFSLIDPKDAQLKQEYLAYMKQENLLPNEDFQFGKLPTYGELREILSRLPQYTARFGRDIDLILSNGEVWTLFCLNYVSDDSATADFYWKYTSEPLIPLIQAIADICGNMVIANDSSSELVFIYPNAFSENNPAHK